MSALPSSVLLAFRIYRISVGSLAILMASTNFLGLATLLIVGGINLEGALVFVGVAGYLIWILFRWGIVTAKNKARPFHSRIDVVSRTFFVTLFMALIGISVAMQENQRGYLSSPVDAGIIIMIFLATGAVIGSVASIFNNIIHTNLPRLFFQERHIENDSFGNLDR